jgi:hypothetical protein
LFTVRPMLDRLAILATRGPESTSALSPRLYAGHP